MIQSWGLFAAAADPQGFGSSLGQFSTLLLVDLAALSLVDRKGLVHGGCLALLLGLGLLSTGGLLLPV